MTEPNSNVLVAPQGIFLNSPPRLMLPWSCCARQNPKHQKKSKQKQTKKKTSLSLTS